jgi:hypothetical protein
MKFIFQNNCKLSVCICIHTVISVSLVGPCEDGNESLGSIRVGEFLD